MIFHMCCGYYHHSSIVFYIYYDYELITIDYIGDYSSITCYYSGIS